MKTFIANFYTKLFRRVILRINYYDCRTILLHGYKQIRNLNVYRDKHICLPRSAFPM